ncbi:hypothetical protein FSP39_007582 [Pinctada imbricata]|uniref:Uncharacterized protein n=1 Tax=Pinctada imbricata TaxID=66713 RepID=A0AA88Y7T7_PINIB|nr:hypothetical protein FSP39_007582 [Pinctada imbricata]
MDGPESIAIVGVGCKFPGADNLEEFWRVLEQGEDHVQDIPKERFNVDAFYDENPDVAGKLYMKKAGLVKGFHEWDNQFYGIGDTEARQTDPQQRFVLDCVHMAFEDAGITKDDVNGTDTGVYIGMMNDDYKVALLGQDELINNYSVTGSHSSVISARVSYFYNLLGPSLVLDTACSSALVAIHLAATAIKSGDISMAVCGGVNCLINPETFISLSKARMASPSGKCQTFSKYADGYARGEGCGIVILKKLSKAVADNNKIWGIIATGCNQDGHTTSPITAPSSVQQMRLLEKVFNESNVCPSTVQYIEAHGTGTPVGDPIEANTLGTFFSDRNKGYCSSIHIGSVKTNIGHLESAAGVAGLIKILLMMKNGKIVPSLHSKELNPKITFEKYGLNVPQRVTTWSTNNKGEKVACINSFGFGGTNSHAIVKEIKQGDSVLMNSAEQTLQIITLSANDSEALTTTVERYVGSASKSKYTLESLAYTSTVKRDHHRFRTFIIADCAQNVLESNFASIQNPKPVSLKSPSLTFVFCGVGTAWQGMCTEMLERFHVFAETVRDIDHFLRPLAKWSIFEIFAQGKPVIDDPMINHIAIFTCQIALVHLWRSFGVNPDFVIGQSVGEVAAAYTSEALSLEQAVTVIYHRSNVLAEATGGGMAVVRGIGYEEVERLCSALKCGKVDTAVYISKECCTVSGDKKALSGLKTNLSTYQGIRWIDLDVQCAYHSHFTKEPGNKLADEIRTLQPSSNKIPVFSSVTGGEIMAADHYCRPSYWALNVAEKVKFYQAVLESRNKNPDAIYLEIGPSPVLRSHASNIFPDDNTQVIPSFKKNSEFQQCLTAAGQLYMLGLNLNWRTLFVHEPPLADIPKYCFNCKPLFEESVVRKMKRNANINMTSQGILTEKKSNGNFSVILSEQTTPYVFEHIVEESVIVPGAFYGSMGIELGKAVLGLKDDTEVQWTIETPLAVSVKQSSEIEIEYKKVLEENDKQEAVLKYRILDAKKQVLSIGSVSKTSMHSVPDTLDIQDQKDDLSKKPKDEFIYKTLQRFGFHHGPLYRIIQKGMYSKDNCFVEVHLNERQISLIDGNNMHPIIIDGMLQSCCAFLPFIPIPTDSKLFPVGIGKLLTKQKVTQKMYIYSKIKQKTNSSIFCNSILVQENGIVVAEMLNIELSILSNTLSVNELSLQFNWQNFMLQTGKTSHAQEKTMILYRGRNAPDVSFGDREFDSMCIDNFEAAKKVILSKTPKLLVYIPGCIRDQVIIQEIYDEIVNDGKTFLKLVQTFSHLDVKIAVLTEATQNLNEGQLTVNLLGSELWGMVRSISREPTKLSLYLIDTYPNVQQNNDVLRNLFCWISEDDSDIPFETCVVNGEIRFGYVQEMFEKRSMPAPIEEQEFLARKSMQTRQAVRSLPTNEQESTTTVTVTVSFTCHNIMDVLKGQGSTTLTNIGEIWASDERIQVGINHLEFTGILLDKHQRQREVVCCYPCRSNSEISVPKQFLFFKDEIPNYVPGMLQSCILAMTIAEVLTDTKRVVTIADETFQETVQILKQIFKQKGIIFTPSSEMDNLHLSDLKKATLLMLTSCRRSISNMAEMNYFTKVLFFDNGFGATFRDKGEFVSPDQIFSLQNISQKMKNARKILKKLNGLSVMMQACEVSHWKIRKQTTDPRGYPNHGNVLVKERSSYIVVGGFTGLGWLLVKELARCGALKIIIFSRKSPNEEMKRKIQGLTNLYKVQVIPVQVDICNQQDLSRVFFDLESICKNEPIRGIFQGAAVTADKLSTEMSLDQYEVPLRPKILGTLNLDQVSRNLKLDYFVIHSSIAALLGNIGQCNYAAGNSFQDCLALYRRSIGLPATSIVWTALDVGLASDAITKDSLRSQGLMSLSQQQILECTHRAIFSGEVHRIFAHIDWKVFLQNFITSLKFKFKDFWKDSNHKTSTTQQKNENYNFVDDDATVKMVLNCLASVFTLEPSQISLSTPIVEYGLDSQKGTELASLIFERSNIRVPYIYLATDDHSVSDISQFVKNKQQMQVSNVKSMEDKSHEKPLKNAIEDLLLGSRSITYNTVHLVVADTTIDLCSIQKSLHLLLLLHPELRKSFYIQTDSEGRKTLKKEIKEIEEAILKIEVTESESIDELLEARSVQNEAFRIKIARRKDAIDIVLMICPLMFDACSVEIIIDEVKKALVRSSNTLGRSPMFGIMEVNPSPSYEDFLEFDEENMNRYWSSELLRQKDALLPKSEGASNALRWSSHCIPDRLVGLLQRSLSANDMSMYQVMCCFAQIGLAMVTKAQEVTVLAQSDMRSFTGLDDSTIGMHSNVVPLISDFKYDKDISLQDFITRNIKKMISIQEEEKFPFHRIQNLGEFDESKHQSLFCFFVDEEKLTKYRNPVEVKGYRPGFISIASVELMIVSTRHQLTLYVNSHESHLGTGVALLDSIKHVLDLYVQSDRISIEELILAVPKKRIIGTTYGTYKHVNFRIVFSSIFFWQRSLFLSLCFYL